MLTIPMRWCVGLLVVLGLTSYGLAEEAMNPKAMKVNYARPFEPPTRPALIPLPAGAVEPQGWLRDWCLAARDGYTGHMDEYHVAFKQAWAADYKMTGDNLFWPAGGWPYEGGGYWFEGLALLAYALHDESLIEEAKARFEPVVANMNDKAISFLWWLDRNNADDMKYAEGRHYRENEWPFWANGLFGRAMAAYVAASKDPRGIKAMEHAYTGSPDWVRLGWGLSNVWPAFEAYRWTGNAKIKEGLTALFTKEGDDKRRWPTNPYRRRPPAAGPGNDHGVHFLESTAPWAIGYLWTGNREFLGAAVAWHRLVERDSMQPFGVICSDEHWGPTGAFRSTETCNVAGHLWSKLLLLTIGGDGAMADQIERAFFNAAPAMVTRDFKSAHVYFQSPNRMANRSLPAPGQCTYSRTHGPLCCSAALNRPLPYYVTHMWMATHDNGLAFTAYGPCKVTALAGDGVPVELVCRTDYPFNDTIEIAVKPRRAAEFPLLLRVPGWCKRPVMAVNGAPVEVKADEKGFVRIRRAWKDGDTISLRFPMSVEVATGTDKNCNPPAPYATVSYGPLLFALPIADKDPNTPDPAARWNYALDAAAGEITVERGTMPARWDWPLASPLKLRAHALNFGWKPGPRQPLPPKPIGDGLGESLGLDADEAAPQLIDQSEPPDHTPAEITLVPYGCTKFRISMFPVTEKAWKRLAAQVSAQPVAK